MKSLTGRFKIDVNTYPSVHWPVALYKEVQQRRLLWTATWWEHCESFATKEEAREHFKKMKVSEQLDGLPEIL
jgi:hypothetical protein